MAKKNQKLKLRKLVEEIEPFEPQVKSTESGLADPQDEAVPSEATPQDTEQTVEVSSEGVEASTEKPESTPDSIPAETPHAPASIEEESSADDVLADVRQSLIEEESLEKEKPAPWWRKIGKGRKKDKVARPPEPVSKEEIKSPGAEMSVGAIEEQAENKESEEYLEQIDELIDMLEPATEEDALVSRVAEEVPTPSETVHKIDLDELKKQAFRPRETGAEADNFSEVRSITLEGDEEVFVEVESKVEDPLEERLKAFENAIKPYRRQINIAFAVLGAVMAVIAGLLLYNVYQQLTPKETPVVVSNLPFPTSVSLPGGWSFNLGKGALQDGQWNPQGAEWLEGTEVCRWVALPWSRQLEAVIRTLNPDDPIELVMSNNDRFVYMVYSVRQLTSEEMLDLDSNSPCLLVVLAEADSESRWVLTALP
jgi:hypothetical protein